jgi:hypothetical protein
MSSTRINIGLKNKGLWYKSFDQEEWITICKDENELSDCEASIIIKEYYDEKFAKSDEEHNYALQQAFIKLAEKHGQELFEYYSEQLKRGKY